MTLQQMRIDPATDTPPRPGSAADALVVDLPSSRIALASPGVQLAGEAAQTAAWEPIGRCDGWIASIAGTIRRWRGIGRRWTLVREHFIAADGSLHGVRLHLTNTSDAPLLLRALAPVRVDGPEGLRLAAGDAGAWRIVRGGRQKNDVPGNVRLTDDDIDLEHARIDAAEFKAGSGVQASDLASASSAAGAGITADPYLWIKHRHDPVRPALFIGVLGQSEHLTRIHLDCGPAGDAFHCLSVVAEMDDVVVRPGETRTTHWVVFYEGADEEALRRRHVELVAELLQVPPPGPPPSYFCSWYFYGTDFTQADLDENLAGLKRRPIPFDFFVIDNGWMTDFGTWEANDRFPLGMKHAADCIRAAGYRPGIWTAPFVIMRSSPALQRYPNLIARDADGQPVLFPYEQTREHVVDPTSPDAEAYFAELFARLRAWGFTVHKFDFLRAITSNPRIRFHDRSMNRAQAYRHGLAMLRRLAGPDAYILGCGGLFEASAGLVDGMRIGADTKGRWSDPTATTAYHRMGYVVRIKQNVFRNHTNRLWHTDPDAMQLRLRREPFRGNQRFLHLAQGMLTDDEAMTVAVHQYLGGGIVCLCERMDELPDARWALLRKALPAVTPPARVVDFDHAECPTTFWTLITPPWASDRPWATLIVCNWADEAVVRHVRPNCVPPLAGCPRLAVMELVTGSYLGVHGPESTLAVSVPAHGTRVLRLAPWDRVSPVLLGTDGHLSGGAAELAELTLAPARVRGTVGWKWRAPLRLWVGVPGDGGLAVQAIQLDAAERSFDRALETRQP